MDCICGCREFERYDKQAYEVNGSGVTSKVNDKPTALGKCSRCGVIRQVEMPFRATEDFVKYYRTQYAPVDEKYGAKDYGHDLQLAKARCRAYKVGPGRLLDVGSGSGAFVEAARSQGAEAYGCEIGKYHYAGKADEEFVYRGRFEDVNFPTDHFKAVACHDVLEHVLDPVGFIAELFRVTDQQGICWVDFPRYFHESGKHHWKRFEHIWFFAQDQLTQLFKSAGFTVSAVSNPIESKILFKLIKPVQDRPSILVPPGMGDSYWSVVKLRAFLERERLGIPDIYVVCPREKKYEGHKRSFPFLEMFPFLHSTGVSIEGADPKLRPIWKEAYARPSRTIFTDVDGFDYFIAYNGNLRVGKSLDQIDPDLACEWFPPMFVSLEQERYKKEAIAKHGRYIAFYFPFQGTYQYWTREFPVKSVVKSIIDISKRTRFVPVFVGAKWDADNETLRKVKSEVPGGIDLTGKTSIEQLFGLLRGSQGVVGYPSGLTIMSVVLGQKTVIIWNDFYNRDFVRHGLPPSTWEKNYFAENTLHLTPDYLAAWTTEKISGEPCDVQRIPLTQPNNGIAEVVDGKPETAFLPKSVLRRRAVTRSPAPVHDAVVAPVHDTVVVCVLKTGGAFDEKYVLNLKSMVNKNLPGVDFVCLTDLPVIDGCDTLSLDRDLLGWWSKVELFRPGLTKAKRIIYFDLDTLILGPVGNMLKLNGDFFALRPWNRANWSKGFLASGVMSWTVGAFDFLFTEFTRDTINQHLNDQAYFSAMLASRNIKYLPLQDLVSGIYSYKRQCRNGPPMDARIVCFHGRPRVHECQDKWVREAWK